MRKILTILSLSLVFAIAMGSLVVAYVGGIRGLGLLGVWFFLTFGIIVVLAQVIPAGIILTSFIKAVFTPYRESELPVRAT